MAWKIKHRIERTPPMPDWITPASFETANGIAYRRGEDRISFPRLGVHSMKKFRIPVVMLDAAPRSVPVPIPWPRVRAEWFLVDLGMPCSVIPVSVWTRKLGLTAPYEIEGSDGACRRTFIQTGPSSFADAWIATVKVKATGRDDKHWRDFQFHIVEDQLVRECILGLDFLKDESFVYRGNNVYLVTE